MFYALIGTDQPGNLEIRRAARPNRFAAADRCGLAGRRRLVEVRPGNRLIDNPGV